MIYPFLSLLEHHFQRLTPPPQKKDTKPLNGSDTTSNSLTLELRFDASLEPPLDTAATSGVSSRLFSAMAWKASVSHESNKCLEYFTICRKEIWKQLCFYSDFVFFLVGICFFFFWNSARIFAPLEECCFLWKEVVFSWNEGHHMCVWSCCMWYIWVRGVGLSDLGSWY